MKKKEIVSLNLCRAELSNEMKLDERIEKLNSAMRQNLKGGANCVCYDMCLCNVDCPMEGCVDCFCYGMEDMPHCGAFT
ncbi:hypothetical protein [Bacteroides sp.]